VTIGANEKAMFVMAGRDAPESFVLFERAGRDYQLNLAPGMTGRIALRTGIQEIEALLDEGLAGHAHRVRLTEDARGKVVVGEATFLFQFVSPPPPQPYPQLPLSVKGGLGQRIDWNLTILAAFSFLLHFGVIGAMCSDWMDPPLNENLAIRLIDLSPAIPPVNTETPAETSAETATSSSPVANEPSHEKKLHTGAARARDSAVDHQAATLARDAETMRMQVLASLGSGPAVDAALRRSDIPLPSLDEAARSPSGITKTGGELRIASGDHGVVRPGASGRGLASIANTSGGTIGGVAGPEAPIKGPARGDAQISPPIASVPVADAESVVSGLRAKFRICYNRGLAADPSMAGTVTVVTKVAPNGEVGSAEASSVSGLSPAVVSCIQSAVRNAQFHAPGGSGSTINIPVKFVQQGT